MKCKVRGCRNKAIARGLCPKHYKRVKLYGDPGYVKQKQYHGLSLKERFNRRIKKTKYCWTWTGYVDPKGYGRIHAKGNPSMLAHRLSWELHFGLIPKGVFVLHRCDNPCCVRPDHLFLGSQNDNVQDMIKKGKQRHVGLKGVKHNMAKLNNTQVLEIRDSNKTGVFLANKYHVSTSTISDIRNKKIWKHL